jgi:hypothetical protein
MFKVQAVDIMNNKRSQKSLAAFIGNDSALMIHAETVADLSGASDYSNLLQAECGVVEF